MGTIYSDIDITNLKFIERDVVNSNCEYNYKISFCKLIDDKLYISYIYEFSEFYCSFIILDIKTYAILENKIFKDCTFSDFIDDDLYLVIDENLHKYNNEDGLVEIDFYYGYKKFMFKHNDEVYFLLQSDSDFNLYNISNNTLTSVPLNLYYEKLNIYYSKRILCL